MEEKTSARENVEFAIRCALAETAHITGLRIDSCEPVVDAIVESLFSAGTVWCVREYADEHE